MFVDVFSKKHFLKIRIARNIFDEFYFMLDFSIFLIQQSFFIFQLLFLQIMRIDIMINMLLNTFYNRIYASHNIAYILIDLTKTETKTKTKRKQKCKTILTTTLRCYVIKLSID